MFSDIQKRAIMRQAISFRDEVYQLGCPRGAVGAMIVDQNGNFLGQGRNLRPHPFGPCDCNHDPVGTAQGASSTCRAIHAEQAALLDASSVNRYNDMYAVVTTRPPCKVCLSLLASTPIQLVITLPDHEDRDESKGYWVGAAKRRWEVLDMGN